MNTTLQIICVVLGVFGIGLFLRAYHLGNETLGKINKTDQSENKH
jgi:hypothetical protein